MDFLFFVIYLGSMAYVQNARKHKQAQIILLSKHAFFVLGVHSPHLL